MISKGEWILRDTIKTTEQFVVYENLPENEEYEIVICINQNNLDYIERTLLERSTPGNPQYQKWFSFDEVGKITENIPSFLKVTAWLNHSNVNIKWVSPYNHYIKANAKISLWHKLFQNQFYKWKHVLSDTCHIRAFNYSLPVDISPHISAVLRIIDIPPTIQKHSIRKYNSKIQTQNSHETKLLVKPASSNTVTISYLDQYYQIPSNIGNLLLFFCITLGTTINFIYTGNKNLSQAVFATNTKLLFSARCYTIFVKHQRPR
jgi:hypothetical protein